MGNLNGSREDEEEREGAVYPPGSEEITEEDPGGDFYLPDNFTNENWDNLLVIVEVILRPFMTFFILFSVMAYTFANYDGVNVKHHSEY